MSGKKTIKNGQRKKAGRKVVGLSAAAVILTAGAIAGWVLLRPLLTVSSQAAPQTVTVQSGNLILGVTASGTTALGSVTQPVSSAISGLSLDVEKVLAATGNTVKQGQALLQITADSLTAARTSLTSAVSDARVKLAQAEVDHASALVAAEADRLANLSLSVTAKSQYQATLDNLSNAVATAKESRDGAKSVIADYPGQITEAQNSSAALKAQQAAAEATLAQSRKDLTQAQSAYDVAKAGYSAAQAAVDQALAIEAYARAYAASHSGTLGVGGEYADFLAYVTAGRVSAENALAALAPGWQASQAALAQAQAAVSASDSAVNGVKQQIAALEQSITTWTADLAKAKSNLPSYQIKYDQALNSQKKQALTAEQTYQSSLLLARNAESLYAIAIESADKALTAAQDAASLAEDKLAEFEAEVTDGTIKASYDGALTALNYAADNVLSSSTAVATYANASLMTFKVTIDQTDIAGIKVGDQVPVTFSANNRRSYTGVITSIATTSGSTSKSDVNYAVTIRIDGDLTGLTSGLTATVSIVKETLSDVLYLPVKAIHTGSSGDYVLKQVNGQSVEAPVTTGESNGTYIVIASGLAKGDICILPSADVKS